MNREQKMEQYLLKVLNLMSFTPYEFKEDIKEIRELLETESEIKLVPMGNREPFILKSIPL